MKTTATLVHEALKDVSATNLNVTEAIIIVVIIIITIIIIIITTIIISIISIIIIMSIITIIISVNIAVIIIIIITFLIIFTNAMIPNYLKDYDHSFTVMSLNCQSIKAKFGLLEAMLYELLQSDFAHSAICIQKSWLSGNPHDMAAFQIPGYHTIARNSTVGRNGGLIIYLKDDYSYKIMNAHAPSNMWECMFLEISGGSLPQPIPASG